MRAVVTGGSGFVGCHLVKLLIQEGYSVTILTRSPDFTLHKSLHKIFQELEDSSALTLTQWDPTCVTDNLVSALEGADIIFHLAGTSILQKRWTKGFMKELVDSRVISSSVIVDGIGKCTNKPPVLVAASGISYYGDCGDNILTEESPAGSDFLATLSVAWEEAVAKAKQHGVRTCSARIGIVLGMEGGALQQMYPMFSWHVGGHIGNGKNWYPWVHVGDCVGALLYAATNEKMEGGFNNVSPNPVTMSEFCRQLGVASNRWSWAHAPYFVIRLLLGEVATAITSSLRAQPKKLEECGYQWQYPSLEEALKNLI